MSEGYIIVETTPGLIIRFDKVHIPLVLSLLVRLPCHVSLLVVFFLFFSFLKGREKKKEWGESVNESGSMIIN